jgi:hypothetical protein
MGRIGVKVARSNPEVVYVIAESHEGTLFRFATMFTRYGIGDKVFRGPTHLTGHCFVNNSLKEKASCPI